MEAEIWGWSKSSLVNLYTALLWLPWLNYADSIKSYWIGHWFSWIISIVVFEIGTNFRGLKWRCGGELAAARFGSSYKSFESHSTHNEDPKDDLWRRFQFNRQLPLPSRILSWTSKFWLHHHQAWWIFLPASHDCSCSILPSISDGF